MNFVGSNYKYMYRGCRNVWTYCVSKLRNDYAQWKTLGIFIIQTCVPLLSPFLWTARPIKCLAAGLSLVCSCVLFWFFISLLWRKERPFGEFVFSGLWERDAAGKTTRFLLGFFLSRSSLTGLIAANRLLAKSTKIQKWWMEVQENSSVLIYNYKEDNCNMKRKILKKSLWNV